MRNLKTIEKKVRAVLEKNEDARNDDMVLYLALCNACLKDAGAMPLATHHGAGIVSLRRRGNAACRDNDAAQISRSAEL